jgi:hypothetical protein
MNTFWKRLRPSVNDPDGVRARLVRIFRDSRAGEKFTLDDLTDEVKADRKEKVAFFLGQLTSKKLVCQIVTVVSPEGGGIADFEDIKQVPSELFDPFQLKDIDVDPSLIRIYFTKRVSGSEKTILARKGGVWA